MSARPLARAASELGLPTPKCPDSHKSMFTKDYSGLSPTEQQESIINSMKLRLENFRGHVTVSKFN